MSGKPPVVVLEFNELTPSILFPMMENGHLPHFKELFESSRVFETDAGEDGYSLNPWVQWVTVHTGLTFKEHEVFLLGEGHTKKGQSLLTLARQVVNEGMVSWQCGSMNIPVVEHPSSYAIPDPWAGNAPSSPEKLKRFISFVQRNVQEHSNPSNTDSIMQGISFFHFMVRNGLSIRSFKKILLQLLNELAGTNQGWKRALLLDYLQFDLFASVFRRTKPSFSTLFSNSVAHMQHAYWRDFDPEKFGTVDVDYESHPDAIPMAYKTNDEIIGRCLQLAPEAYIFLCTGLSQQPAVEWDDKGGKGFYRPYDFKKFIKYVGVDTELHCEPVMAEEFWIQAKDPQTAVQVFDRLRACTVGNQQAFKASVKGDRVYTGCQIYTELPNDSILSNGLGEELEFFKLFYRSDEIKSGKHSPRGLCWIRQPDKRHSIERTPVPLTSVAPTIANCIGIRGFDLSQSLID